MTLRLLTLKYLIFSVWAHLSIQVETRTHKLDLSLDRRMVEFTYYKKNWWRDIEFNEIKNYNIVQIHMEN